MHFNAFSKTPSFTSFHQIPLLKMHICIQYNNIHAHHTHAVSYSLYTMHNYIKSYMFIYFPFTCSVYNPVSIPLHTFYRVHTITYHITHVMFCPISYHKTHTYIVHIKHTYHVSVHHMFCHFINITIHSSIYVYRFRYH